MTEEEIARLNEVAETLRKTYDEGGLPALRRLLVYNWAITDEYNNGEASMVGLTTTNMDVDIWADGDMISAINDCAYIKLDAELTDAIIRASMGIPSNVRQYPHLFVEPGTLSKKDMDALCASWDWFLECTPGDITAEKYIQWMHNTGLFDRDFFELRIDVPEFKHFAEEFGFADRFEDFLKGEIEYVNAKTYARLLPAIEQIADAIRYYWE